MMTMMVAIHHHIILFLIMYAILLDKL